MGIVDDLKQFSSHERAKISQRFFKTGPGQYGEGDIFIGITVPDVRRVCRKYRGLAMPDIERLLASKIHEHRLAALLILVHQFKGNKKEIFSYYLMNAKQVNNWDLVDISAPGIVGEYVAEHPNSSVALEKLAESSDIWERRIAIIATLALIRKNDFEYTFKVAAILMNDNHDLIHKAVGWMLREVGKKNQLAEEKFLLKHYKTMPRTMLRYAIERFDECKRKFFMNGR